MPILATRSALKSYSLTPIEWSSFFVTVKIWWICCFTGVNVLRIIQFVQFFIAAQPSRLVEIDSMLTSASLAMYFLPAISLIWTHLIQWLIIVGKKYTYVHIHCEVYTLLDRVNSCVHKIDQLLAQRLYQWDSFYRVDGLNSFPVLHWYRRAWSVPMGSSCT